MESLWIETFKYHQWANAHLVDQCSKLTEEQLQLTAPGTYGTIAKTWQHLVAAEQGYIMRLGGSQRLLSGDDPFPGMAKIAEHLSRSDGEGTVEATARRSVTGPSPSTRLRMTR